MADGAAGSIGAEPGSTESTAPEPPSGCGGCLSRRELATGQELAPALPTAPDEVALADGGDSAAPWTASRLATPAVPVGRR